MAGIIRRRALLENQSSGETWVINQSPTINNSIYTTINFISNDINFAIFEIVFDEEFFRQMIAYGYAGEPVTKPVYDVFAGWDDSNYRTVTFSESPTGDLLTWLQNNAVQQ